MFRLSRSAVVAGLLAATLSVFAAPPAEQFFEIKVPEVGAEDRICFCLYTVEKRVMKMTAQLYPLPAEEPREVSLELKRGDAWEKIASAPVNPAGWTAVFRVEGWDSSRDVIYRVSHNDTARFSGRVKMDPVDKREIVVAAFTGNSIYENHGGDISRDDLVANVKAIKPDLLFFSGDQVYDHTRHYAYWLKFGRDFGGIIKDIPTVTIPDDHDVGQGNLWGSSGKKASSISGDDGGYFMPAEYVKEVERAQTSHLPDPHDPTPVQQGIGVYYTSLNVGGIDFAILEDRKFKTGWLEVLDEEQVPRDPFIGRNMRPHAFVNDEYDPFTLDVPEAKLLGDRQLEFLRAWTLDWDRSVFKCVLSQTTFCDSADRYYEPERRRYVDFDCNGWPQTGRNNALIEMRKAFAFHLNGDTHLGTVFQYGVNEWNDAGWSFTVPSIANLYMRWWAPDRAGANRAPGRPDYTGEHLDGFGNKITCHAVANPSFDADPRSPEGNQLSVRAAGFGVVRFDKDRRSITMECWPRNVDVTKPDARQYGDWPVVISQQDNYGRRAVAHLPVLQFVNAENPVVRIEDAASGEHVYSLRIRGREFRPKVFRKGRYDITVREGGREKTLTGVPSVPTDERSVLRIEF